MLKFRKATLEDLDLYFKWANDSNVRKQSYNSKVITYDEHCIWYKSKINDVSTLMLIFQSDNNQDIGQIRIQKQANKQAIIGISISKEYRGKGYAKEMLILASEYFLNLAPKHIINAYIKKENTNSQYVFEKAGFKFKKELLYENIQSFHYIKK